MSAPEWRADVYAPDAARSRRSGASVFALEDLRTNLRRYDSIIFFLGNSEHWVPIVRAYHSVAALARETKLYVYAHDPCVLGLVGALMGAEADRHLITTYADAFRGAPIQLIVPELLRNGVSGFRALFGSDPPDGIFVNSRAAADIIAADSPRYPRAAVRVLFHPVFEPHPLSTGIPHSGRTRIGTFGIQTPEKCPELLIGAFRLLQARRADIELILAGYEVASFAAASGLDGMPNVSIYDSPDEPLLDWLIGSVDVAVQLRAANRGESSGMVSRLLAQHRRTIVSELGAFRELGESVRFAPAATDAAHLADLIEHELARPNARTAAMQRYAEAHTTRHFLALLGANLESFLPAM
jgi:hypothetical protein